MTGPWGTPHVAGCRKKKAPHVPDPSKVRLALYQPDIPQKSWGNTPSGGVL